MFFWLGLSVIASLISFIAAVYLVIVAAREHILWALAVLFIPFANIVFAIKNWAVAKKPFLISAGAAAASAVFIIVAMGSAVGDISATMEEDFAKAMEQAGQEMQDQAVEQNFDRQAEPSWTRESAPIGGFESQRDSASVAVAENRAAAFESPDLSSFSLEEPTSIPPIEDIAPVDEYGNIPVNSAPRYVGQTLWVTQKSGATMRGVLSRADGNTLEFKKYLGGGEVIITMDKSKIESMRTRRF